VLSFSDITNLLLRKVILTPEKRKHGTGGHLWIGRDRREPTLGPPLGGYIVDH
jgi:hypothetical protein